MENNNVQNNQDNGRGVFYAVIGVATLVITIIGATFAYLAAATNSAPNAITATGAQVSLGFDDEQSGLKDNLIPIAPTLEQFNKGSYTGDGFDAEGDPAENIQYDFVGINKSDCRDVNGNPICSVYQFTVTNTSTTAAQRVYATFTVGQNSFENLKYALFKGSAADVKDSALGWDVDGDEDGSDEGTDPDGEHTGFTTDYNGALDGSFNKTLSSSDAQRKNVIGNPGDLIIAAKEPVTEPWSAQNSEWNRLTQVLDIGESMTYTMVLYVNETGSKQEDQGKSFAGTVSFTTEGSGTGVTGNLSVSTQ